MRYGIEAGTVEDESMLIAPDNPRVLILTGVSDYNKPVMWGGDIDRAERRLRRTLEQLRASASKPPAGGLPQWGLLDAYGHSAIVLNRLEQPNDALAILNQADADGVQSVWLDRIQARIKH